MADENPANKPVAKEILSYFLRNPEAADSLTELARWRLMEERVRRSVESTEAALNWLIDEGYVQREARLGTESLFRLNPDRRQDAESLLEESSHEDDAPD
ncbi:MAG: hypothetical protein ABSG00_00025 [Terracidiphilus sp.]